MSQHSYSTQPDRLHSPAFSVEPRRTPLSQSVSAFDVTISSRVGVTASLCSHSLTLITAEVLTQLGRWFRANGLRCLHRYPFPVYHVLSGGSLSPMLTRCYLFTSALAVQHRCYDCFILMNQLLFTNSSCGADTSSERLANAMFTRLQPAGRPLEF